MRVSLFSNNKSIKDIYDSFDTIRIRIRFLVIFKISASLIILGAPRRASGWINDIISYLGIALDSGVNLSIVDVPLFFSESLKLTSRVVNDRNREKSPTSMRKVVFQ